MKIRSKIILIIIALVVLTIGYFVYSLFVPLGKVALDFEYSINYQKDENDPNHDYLLYELTVTNNTNKPLYNFDVEIFLSEKLNKFTPRLDFVTEPLKMLPKKEEDSNQNSIIYSRKVLILEASKLNEEDFETLNNEFTKLNVQVSWLGGKKSIVLDAASLKEGSDTLISR